ncbi:MAG: hypothetical protein RIC16_03815 [Rhodospirillales bacterium]
MSATWGQARLEVEALREEILNRLARGETVRRIYHDFKKAKKVTVTERAFYERVRRLQQRPQPQQTTKATAGAGTAPHASVDPLSNGRSASCPTPISAPARTEASHPEPHDEASGGLKKMKLLNLEGLSADQLLAGYTDASTLPTNEKDDQDGND